MKLIIFGATGTSGGEVVRQAILDANVSEIVAITRRPLEIHDMKLKVIRHENYLNYSALTEVFRSVDACAWCLGISQTQVNKQELHTITYDYVVNAAKIMLAANPNITFLFQSGAGADSKEQSKIPFELEKGKTENALQKMGFKKFYIVRPAGIQPIHLNKNTSFFNKLMAPLFPLLKLVAPSLVITSEELARAILTILKNGYNKTIIENKELKLLGK
jgi:uncharacterized protein YbjT (DUF2867 family)